MRRTYVATREALLSAFPRLFIDETDVLHGLFFVTGNGFKWDKGTLTDGQSLCSLVTRAQRDHARFRAPFIAAGFTEVDFPSLRMQDTPETERAQERARRLQLATQKKNTYFLRKDGSVGEALHPLSEYSKILNVPPDVRPDWLASAKLALSSVRVQFKCSVSDEKWLRIAELRLAEFRGEILR
jgi:hypothetical protein